MYLGAKFEERRTELYAMDLLWLLARTKYDIHTPQPTEYELNNKKVDKRNGKQIVNDLMKKLEG